ncbi:MAG TPA: hypothetical protein VMP41_04500 [Acidimicrobiales bacterium]|nr:hypothetical protein [Acidimicrobiales bacterium]
MHELSGIVDNGPPPIVIRRSTRLGNGQLRSKLGHALGSIDVN